MKDLNPDGIIGSHNTFAFQNGDLDIPIPLSTIEFSGANSFQDFDKKEILQKISNYKLSDDMKQFVKEYDRVFGHRDRFLWKWLGVIYGETGVTLSTIDDAYLDSITDTKIILTMAFSFLDDISEFYKDEQLLEKVMDIINNPVGSVDVNDEKLMFFRKIWNYFVNTINKYPRYEEFKDIFWYDFNQVLNSVRYNVLLNKNPEVMNLKEMQNYDCHNMIVFLLNGIDLMVSPEFDKKDLPHLRTVFWHAQQMARIGNWLSTWKREIEEEDFNSGIVGYAISKGVLDVDELRKLKHNKIIDKIENSNIEEYFYHSWHYNYKEIKKLKHKVKSVDLDAYTNGLNNLIKLHLASEGYK